MNSLAEILLNGKSLERISLWRLCWNLSHWEDFIGKELFMENCWREFVSGDGVGFNEKIVGAEVIFSGVGGFNVIGSGLNFWGRGYSDSL